MLPGLVGLLDGGDGDDGDDGDDDGNGDRDGDRDGDSDGDSGDVIGVGVGDVVVWDCTGPAVVGAGSIGLMVETVEAPGSVLVLGIGVVPGTATWHAPGILAAASRPPGTGTRLGPEPQDR